MILCGTLSSDDSISTPRCHRECLLDSSSDLLQIPMCVLNLSVKLKGNDDTNFYFKIFNVLDFHLNVCVSVRGYVHMYTST